MVAGALIKKHRRLIQDRAVPRRRHTKGQKPHRGLASKDDTNGSRRILRERKSPLVHCRDTARLREFTTDSRNPVVA
jgi:hypothetical protein